MNDLLSRAGFLRTSRNFPSDDPKQLSVEVNRAYVDIASKMNNRTIGLFPINRAIANGEAWYVSKGQKQEGLRQVYSWSDSNLTITHGISLYSLTNFVRIWGTFFDGNNWQTLPYVDVTAANNQINVNVNSTQIVITKGGGAPPSCSNGLVVIEWISQP